MDAAVLLNALARSFDPGDGLFATSGPARDVPEGVVITRLI
jgi:hypothetical protein